MVTVGQRSELSDDLSRADLIDQQSMLSVY